MNHICWNDVYSSSGSFIFFLLPFYIVILCRSAIQALFKGLIKREQQGKKEELCHFVKNQLKSISVKKSIFIWKFRKRILELWLDSKSMWWNADLWLVVLSWMSSLWGEDCFLIFCGKKKTILCVSSGVV